MADKREADKLGGSDNSSDYKKPDTTPYCDRGGHRERSEANDTRTGNSHSEHWKKEERKNGRTSLE